MSFYATRRPVVTRPATRVVPGRRYVTDRPRDAGSGVLPLGATLRELRATLARVPTPVRPEVAIARQVAPLAVRASCLALRVALAARGGR